MKKLIFTFILYACVTVFCKAQTNPQYEYITVAQRKDEISVSTAKKYEVIKISTDDFRGWNNFWHLLKKVEELEKEGFELVSNNVFSDPAGYISNVFLMRKKRN